MQPNRRVNGAARLKTSSQELSSGLDRNWVGCLRAGFGPTMEILRVSPSIAKMPGT